MPIARWLVRDSLRALAVTLLIPAALLGALLAATLGEGLGGLGSLRQIVAGPSVTRAVRTAAPRPARASSARPSPVRAPATRPASVLATRSRAPAAPRSAGAPEPARAPFHRVSAPGARPGPGRGAPSTPAPSTPVHALPVRPPARPPDAGPPPAGASRPTPPAPSAPPPPRQPSAVHQLGDAVQGAAKSLPAPVGPAAGEAVGRAVGVVERGSSATGVLSGP